MLFKRSAHCCVTQPVTSKTSACLGEGSSFTPKRSTSYFGVSKATISMSHPLQAPELKCKTQGDFTRAHVTVFAINLYLRQKEPSLRQAVCQGRGLREAGLCRLLKKKQKRVIALMS